MKKVFAIASISALLLQTQSVAIISEQPVTPKSFANCCQQRNSAPAATVHTINILLKKAGTENCQRANSRLRTITRINLSGQITDIKPLSSLTNSKELDLSYCQISDLKPLNTLINLTYLRLSTNQISDLEPLSRLIKLTDLDLKDNKISDVNPLVKLINLTSLSLSVNKISNIKPLASLTNLKTLDIKANKITKKDCPVKSATCYFENQPRVRE
jgi:internalin A